jgi:hypothetical protein
MDRSERASVLFVICAVSGAKKSSAYCCNCFIAGARMRMGTTRGKVQRRGAENTFVDAGDKHIVQQQDEDPPPKRHTHCAHAKTVVGTMHCWRSRARH